MSTVKDSKKRSMPSPMREKSVENINAGGLDVKVDGPAAKRQKLPDNTVPPTATVMTSVGVKTKIPNQVPLAMRPGLAGVAAAAGTAAAALQHSAAAKQISLANGLAAGNLVVPNHQGALANVAAAASLMGPLATVPPPHLVGHPQILAAGQNPPFPNAMQPGLPGAGHNQIKAFLDHISLGQYWRLLSENGCDTLEDLATADVQMLVNLGFKIFHANRLVTAVHRFIRPAPPVINTPTKRKRASHVRTFAEMYQRVEEFQNLVNQVGSMSAAERDPRSTISRGAYTQYLRIKELAEKSHIQLTSEKYVNIKPTEKNVKDIIQKEKGIPGVNVVPVIPGAPPNVNTVSVNVPPMPVQVPGVQVPLVQAQVPRPDQVQGVLMNQS